MDNFKGQTMPSLEENYICVCLLPPNTTDSWQLLDIAVNKPAKEFYRQKFHLSKFLSRLMNWMMSGSTTCRHGSTNCRPGSSHNEGVRGKVDREDSGFF